MSKFMDMTGRTVELGQRVAVSRPNNTLKLGVVENIGGGRVAVRVDADYVVRKGYAAKTGLIQGLLILDDPS